MNDIEALNLIGGFVTAARVRAGLTQVQLAEQAGIDVKTFRVLESGTRLLHEKKLQAVEKVLGWRSSSIRHLWETRAYVDPTKASVEDMYEEPGHESWSELASESKGPVTKASQLTNEELLMELQYRFRNLEIQVTRMKDAENGASTDH